METHTHSITTEHRIVSRPDRGGEGDADGGMRVAAIDPPCAAPRRPGGARGAPIAYVLLAL